MAPSLSRVSNVGGFILLSILSLFGWVVYAFLINFGVIQTEEAHLFFLAVISILITYGIVYLIYRTIVCSKVEIASVIGITGVVCLFMNILFARSFII